jgi:hypothetical protein
MSMEISSCDRREGRKESVKYEPSEQNMDCKMLLRLAFLDTERHGNLMVRSYDSEVSECAHIMRRVVNARAG